MTYEQYRRRCAETRIEADKWREAEIAETIEQIRIILLASTTMAAIAREFIAVQNDGILSSIPPEFRQL